MIAPGWVEDLAWLVVWNVRYCAQGGSEVEMQIVGKRDSSGRGARALLQLSTRYGGCTTTKDVQVSLGIQ